MMNAQTPDHISLNVLISYLRQGKYVIPDFQREFEWEPSDIRELIRSIFQDYYIGSLLLWKGMKKNFNDFACEPIYGYNGTERPEWIVLDGQQRLTAIYYAFLAPDMPLPNHSTRAFYFINIDKFMAEEYEEAFNYEWKSRRLDRFLNDREVQYQEHILPLAIFRDGLWSLGKWLDGYEEFWHNRANQLEALYDTTAVIASDYANNAKAFKDYLECIMEQYQISFIELDQDIAPYKVCDIFSKINSQGKPLDAFDLINALLKPKGLQLKQMWRNAAPRLEKVKTKKMNVYILQVMSILRQSYCSPKYLYFLLPGYERPIRDPDGTRRKDVLVPDTSDFTTRWDSAVMALETAIKILLDPKEFGIISTSFLPYVSILPVFAALRSRFDELSPRLQFGAGRKLRYWYWASVFTNRYSGSVESTSTRDFIDMCAWFENDSDEPPMIAEFIQRFRHLSLRKETKRGTSIYNGIFNLLVLQGARDWITTDFPKSDELDDHHIVPLSWGTEHMKDDKDDLINSILNRTPLTKKTNRHVINDRLPNTYLRELIEQNGEAKVRAIFKSHCISPTAFDILSREQFGPDDFKEFITEREQTIKDAIDELIIKDRLGTLPQL